MDFIFGIPVFIFHFVTNILSWIVGFFFGIVGLVLWPFKFVWGIVWGLGNFLLSIVLAPLLFVLHPFGIPSEQPPAMMPAQQPTSSVTYKATPALDNTYSDTTYEQSQPSVSRYSNEAIREPKYGVCQCPYDFTKAGDLCGRLSAYVRPGGEEPRCFSND